MDLGQLYAPAYLKEVELGFIWLISSEVPPDRELVFDRDFLSSGPFLIVYLPLNWSRVPSIKKSKK